MAYIYYFLNLKLIEASFTEYFSYTYIDPLHQSLLSASCNTQFEVFRSIDQNKFQYSSEP